MSSITVQLQLNDQQPTVIDLPAQFTMNDFKRALDRVYNNTSFRYSFECHGKELDLHHEDQFNKFKDLITPGITIFTIEHSKCFLSNTLVQRADRSEIFIQDVQRGDVLLGFTEFGEIVTTIVQHTFIHEVDEYAEVRIGNNQLKLTREHPMFIGNGNFCSFDKLRVSDCVYTLIDDELHSTSITSIKIVKAPATCVYNLHTTEPHTYFANRIAVHNKPGMTFVNLNNDHGPKRIEWSYSAPKWRTARPGICLEGKCRTESCKAKGELVVINIGIKNYNLLTESRKMSRCPECSGYVEPIICAFNRCEWRWEGLTQSEEGSEPKEVSGEWKVADNAYHRFDENISGTIRWLHLILEARVSGTK